MIFGFGGFYLLVRLLDKPHMGSYTLFITVTSMAEVARVGFIKYGFIKLRADAKEDDHGKLYTAALALNACFALLVSAGMLLLGAWLSILWKSPELKNMFYLYAITSLVLVPFFQFEYLQHALLDFKRVFFAYFIRNGVLFFAILFSYAGLYPIDIFRLAVFNLLGAAAASLFVWVIARKPVSFSYPVLDWYWVKKLAHFGKYVVGTNLVATLYGAVDSFVLGSLLSTASVAVYNVGGRIINLINVPSLSLSTILFPHSAKLINTDGKSAVKELYERSVGAILAIVVPAVIFVLIFSHWIVAIIAPGYSDTVEVLRIVIFISLFLPFSYQFGSTLDSMGYPNRNFYITASFFVTNLTLNYFWILNFGVKGAAFGTLSTTIIGFIITQIILNRMLGVSVLQVFKNMFEFYGQLLDMAKNLVVNKKQ
jgi:lipopolysaccharide exporter